MLFDLLFNLLKIFIIFSQKKVEENRKNLQHQLIETKLATSTISSLQTGESTTHMLSLRMDQPLSKFSGFSQDLGEDDHINKQDVPCAEAIKIPCMEMK